MDIMPSHIRTDQQEAVCTAGARRCAGLRAWWGMCGWPGLCEPLLTRRCMEHILVPSLSPAPGSCGQWQELPPSSCGQQLLAPTSCGCRGLPPASRGSSGLPLSPAGSCRSSRWSAACNFARWASSLIITTKERNCPENYCSLRW